MNIALKYRGSECGEWKDYGTNWNGVWRIGSQDIETVVNNIVCDDNPSYTLHCIFPFPFCLLGGIHPLFPQVATIVQ